MGYGIGRLRNGGRERNHFCKAATLGLFPVRKLLRRFGVLGHQERTSLFLAIPLPAFVLTPVLHGVYCATLRRKRVSPVEQRPHVGHFPLAAAARFSWSFSRSSALRHGAAQNRRRL